MTVVIASLSFSVCVCVEHVKRVKWCWCCSNFVFSLNIRNSSFCCTCHWPSHRSCFRAATRTLPQILIITIILAPFTSITATAIFRTDSGDVHNFAGVILRGTHHRLTFHSDELCYLEWKGKKKKSDKIHPNKPNMYCYLSALHALLQSPPDIRQGPGTFRPSLQRCEFSFV